MNKPIKYADSPFPGREGESEAEKYVRDFGLPGSRAGNAIPPSDTPRYRELQRIFGLRPDQHLSFLKWPQKK